MKTLLPSFLASQKKNTLLANICWIRLYKLLSDILAKTFNDDRFDAFFKVNDLINIITRKLLKAKRKAKAKELLYTYMWRIVFNANYYIKTCYNNKKSCCYVLKVKERIILY